MNRASDVAALIDDFVARGVFRAAPLPAALGEMAVWRIVWFGGHTMRLTVRQDEAVIDDVLPRLPARSPLYSRLRHWLKAQQSADLPAHRRLDPEQIALSIRNRAGMVRLALGSRCESPAELTHRVVQLVNALYLDFLNGPGCLEWVTEAFGLDPDNPRLS